MEKIDKLNEQFCKTVDKWNRYAERADLQTDMYRYNKGWTSKETDKQKENQQNLDICKI